jgi:hypothetical protein
MDPESNMSLDQADEDILTPTVSDDALEAATGTERATPTGKYGPPTSGMACC